jgi:hypothetical protein
MMICGSFQFTHHATHHICAGCVLHRAPSTASVIIQADYLLADIDLLVAGQPRRSVAYRLPIPKACPNPAPERRGFLGPRGSVVGNGLVVGAELAGNRR